MALRSVGASLSAGALALVGTAALAVGSGPAGAAPTTLLSSSTPGATSVSVPAGICSVTITADGGPGGSGVEFSTGSASSTTNNAGGSAPPTAAPGAVHAAQVGGAGATVTATVAATPGSSLAVEVAAASGQN